MQFQVDVSRTFRNKQGYDVGGYKLNSSFVTEKHDTESFIQTVVKEAWPYTMVHLKRSPEESGGILRNPKLKTPKHIENFVSHQILTLDDDRATGSVVEEWLNDPFFMRYGFIFVESSSSTPEKQKGHVLFLFDRPITDPSLYKECIQAMCYKYIHRVDWLINIDRTIYNGEDKPVHVVNKVLPFEVFEREVLLPWRKNEQLKLQEVYERRNKETAIVNGSDRLYEAYLKGFLDWMVNHIANKSKGENRNIAIYWAGRTVAGIKATNWAADFLYVLDDIENRVIDACHTNGYMVDYANNNPQEVLRIYNIGLQVGGSPLEPPVDKRIHVALSNVKPALSDAQKLSAARETQKVIEQLADEKAWIKFNRLLKQYSNKIQFPEQIIDHFMLGLRPKGIDQETGEILPEAITIPFEQGGQIISVEYRHENGFNYEGQTTLFQVKPMFDENYSSVIILPDAIEAINYYLAGDNDQHIYGLPHSNTASIVLPDLDRYCIFDSTTSVDLLEELDKKNVKFIKVPSVERMLKLSKKEDIKKVAMKGRNLKRVM